MSSFINVFDFKLIYFARSIPHAFMPLNGLSFNDLHRTPYVSLYKAVPFAREYSLSIDSNPSILHFASSFCHSIDSLIALISGSLIRVKKLTIWLKGEQSGDLGLRTEGCLHIFHFLQLSTNYSNSCSFFSSISEDFHETVEVIFMD